MNLCSLATAACVIVSSSCSLNKAFLQPTKIPVATKKATIKTKTDTTIFNFSGATFQPTLTQLDGSASDVDYTIESVIFKSTNGNSLNGWMLKPKNTTAKITLLHLHGNSGAILNQHQAISPLLSSGFQIFVFDYSGFGFSTGKATRENILIDALSAFDYLQQRPEVAGTKMLIYGQSIGGHLAAVVAEQRQAKLDGLVIEGAFSSYKAIAGKKVPVLGKLFSKKGFSAIDALQQFEKPVLVIHSTEDKVVPFYMGKKLYSNAKDPKSFYEIEECHICGPQFFATEIAERIKGML